MGKPNRQAEARARLARNAEYMRMLEANPANNRNTGSTYAGGPSGRRRSKRTRKAPRG